METNLSAHGNLTTKVIFMCTTSSHTACYLQQEKRFTVLVHVTFKQETPLWSENLQILQYSHDNLSPIGWKPS